jgi:hypothetical protein
MNDETTMKCLIEFLMNVETMMKMLMSWNDLFEEDILLCCDED